MSRCDSSPIPDAGFVEAGEASRGGHGWAIAGLQEEEGFSPSRHWKLTGGGIVHGQRHLLSSTRCENVGALAPITLLGDNGWQWGVSHRLDNKGRG